jgi:hypothetical protein
MLTSSFATAAGRVAVEHALSDAIIDGRRGCLRGRTLPNRNPKFDRVGGGESAAQWACLEAQFWGQRADMFGLVAEPHFVIKGDKKLAPRISAVPGKLRDAARGTLARDVML